MQTALLWLLRLYKKGVSPWLPPSCRFHPTCSEYMYESIRKRGAVRGVWLGLRRILRCHPWSPGGIDPVP